MKTIVLALALFASQVEATPDRRAVICENLQQAAVDDERGAVLAYRAYCVDPTPEQVRQAEEAKAKADVCKVLRRKYAEGDARARREFVAATQAGICK